MIMMIVMKNNERQLLLVTQDVWFIRILVFPAKISMCNQMVTSEMREKFQARFVQILIIARAFRRGKLLGFGQNASEIIP